jgi:hypothetical protein
VIPSRLINDGFVIEDGFLSESECEGLLAAVDNYRKDFAVPEIYRNVKGRPLKYSVIDGEAICRYLPAIHELIAKVLTVVRKTSGEDVVPLEDGRVACNVNITGRGGSYRWHYDRNRFTALLYLNEVTGGETEMYPNYRINVGSSRTSRTQKLFDACLRSSLIRRLFGRKRIVEPKAGRLLIMKGDSCLHSVRPVESDVDRINIILSYDAPGRIYDVAAGLDSYLYSPAEAAASDPNYVGR